MKWISVKDRLPQTVNVLVAYRFGVMEAKYFENEFRLPNNWRTLVPEVTHWMPLPEPPK